MRKRKIKENKVKLSNTDNKSRQYLPGINKRDTIYMGDRKARRSDYYASLG